MGSIRVYKGMPISEEQKKRIAALSSIKEEDIDYSDIPPLTDEDWKRMRRVNPLPCDLKKVAN